MKKFLALYMGSTSEAAMDEWNSLDEETRKAREKAGMTGWMNWGKENTGVIVDNGSPIGKTKRIDKSGVSDTKNLITGYVIVESESLEDAAKIFVNHPHFTLFPGDAVEVMECLQMPEMEA